MGNWLSLQKFTSNFFLLRISIVFVLFAPISLAFGQHTYIPYGGPTSHILDRLEIKSGQLATDYFHTINKSYRRQAIANYVDSFPVNKVGLSSQDYFNMSYLINDNFEWSSNEGSKSKKPFLKQFYTRKAAMYSAQIKDFNLVVNPVLYYQMSTDKWNGKNALINNRGIEIRGNVGDRIGFYTQVSDEIIQVNSWVGDYRQRTGVMPYANFVKSYPGYSSYFLSSAYVTASLNKYMDLQFGHTRNFIGDGFRTFILGDMNPEYLTMRLNTRIWKMNYTNIWTELRDPIGGAYTIQPRHYMASHHLSLNLGKNFNLGLFETILFHRDSGYVNTGFDINYLNPIIFYKSIENGLNSTDKAIIGINYKYNFAKHFSWYGQIVFSEFVLKELVNRTGWWGNKYAVQTGIKYIDVAGINNLDIQGEFNLARPFMYTSYSDKQTFSNFGQFLGHPLGANFYELVGLIRYQPLNRLNITAKIIYSLYGNDTNGSNFGKDITLSYRSNSAGDYNNFIGQGVETKLLMGDLMATYMPKHNLFVDFKIGYRRTVAALSLFDQETFYLSLGLRLNINYRNYDF
jgi:hypothetical protein